jgi:hypothetical protein
VYSKGRSPNNYAAASNDGRQYDHENIHALPLLVSPQVREQNHADSPDHPKTRLDEV